MANIPTLPLAQGKQTHKVLINTNYFLDLPQEHVRANLDNGLNIEKDAQVELLDEFIGFQGLWSKVLYQEKTIYIKNDFIASTIPEKKSLRAKYTDLDAPKAAAPTIEWTDKPVNVVYFDAKNAYWVVPVLIDYAGNGTYNADLIDALQKGWIEGTKRILKNNTSVAKRNSEKYINEILKKYFFFSRVSDWNIPATQCENIKVLVTLANKYLISDDIESAISTNAVLEGETGFGVGDFNRSINFLKLDFTTFDTFDKQIENLATSIEYYGELQELIGRDQIATQRNVFAYDLAKYKEIVELDLKKEVQLIRSQQNGLNLVSTVRQHLNSNGYDDAFLNSFRNELTGINYNHVLFGFDRDFEICFFNVLKNNEQLNIKGNESSLFSKNVGEGGLLGIRSGHFIYNLPNVVSGQIQQAKDDYATWVDKYVRPPPKEFPEVDLASCVKSNLDKLREDALIIKQNAYNISASYGIKREELDVKIPPQDRPKMGYADFFAAGVGAQRSGSISESAAAISRQFSEYKYVTTAVEILAELDWQKLLIELIKCILAQVPPEQIQALLQKFGKYGQTISNFLNETLCNRLVNFLTSLPIPIFPVIQTVDLEAQFKTLVKQAITQAIKFALDSLFNWILDLLKDCQNSNPLSPYGGLGIDGALDDLLNNPPADDAAVNNLFDGLGIGTDNSPDGVLDQAKKDGIKGLLGDLGCFMNTNELCALFLNAQLSQENYAIIQNFIEKKYPALSDILYNKQQVLDLFVKLGSLLNITQICRDMSQMIEEPCIDCIDANQREKKALTSKDIDPQEIDKILNDLKNKRNKKINELLDLLENGPNDINIPPILCGYDENGNPIPGQVNPATADPYYRSQFENILEGTLADINQAFSKDFNGWGDKIAKRIPSVRIEEVNSLVSQNLSKEQKRNILKEKGLMPKFEKDDDDNQIPYPFDPDKIAQSVRSSKNFDVSPNTFKNLSNESNFRIDYNKYEFKIDSSEEAIDFKNSLVGGLDATINSQINQAVREFNARIAEAFTRRIYPLFSEVLLSTVDVARGGNFDYQFGTSDFSFDFSSFSNGLNTVVGAANNLASFFQTSLIPGAPTLRQRSAEASRNKLQDEIEVRPLNDLGKQIVTIRKRADKFEFYDDSGELIEPTELELKTEAIIESGSVVTRQEVSEINSIFLGLQSTFNTANTNFANFKATSNFSSNNKLVNLVGVFEDLLTLGIEFSGRLVTLTSNYSQTLKNIQALNLTFNNYTIKNDSFYSIENNNIYHKTDLNIFKYSIDNNGPTSEETAFIQDSSKYKISNNQKINLIIKEEDLLANYQSGSGISLDRHCFETFLTKKGITPPDYKEINEEIIKSLRNLSLASLFFNANENNVPYIFGFTIIPPQINGANNARCGVYPSALGVDDIRKEVADNFISSSCNFKIPDVERNAGDTTPAEDAVLESLVYTAIRVYLTDYFLKNVFLLNFSKIGHTKRKTMVNFLASYMESDMKGLNPEYFKRFLDAVVKIHDKTLTKSAKDLEQEFGTTAIEKLRKEKLKKLIESQILFVSRTFSVYGNKILYKDFGKDFSKSLAYGPSYYDVVVETLKKVSADTQSQKVKDFTQYALGLNRFSGPEFNFIFDFCLNIREHLSLLAIYQNLCIAANKNVDKTFNVTKSKIKTYFLTATDGGGPNYRTENYGNNQNLNSELNLQNDEDALQYYLKMLIETPIKILKGAAETGDLNIALSSLPYKIAKPILLTNGVKDASLYMGLSAITPTLSIAITLVAVFTFNITLIPSNLGLAYLLLVLPWLDIELFKNEGQAAIIAELLRDVDLLNLDEEECKRLAKAVQAINAKFYGDGNSLISLEET